MEQKLKAVLATLCRVEVRGKENLDRLLASIQALEKLIPLTRTDDKGGDADA